ncbi:VanZ family protein [Evansella sp. AB-rgal1]|uniref:VanZ family protein n=1 Tax=Evansella sp. AB-rgal1 TaxID=3242696 RepID=UPI00359F0493
MRLQEIVGIVREYFFVALVAVIALMFLFFIGYFLFYRILLKGKKDLSKKNLILWGMFIGYFIMVIGVTFLNRGSGFQGGTNFALFSSYRQAWHSFSLRHWQFVILNIIMFVPFGILFPLLHKRFQKAIVTIGAAALFTLSIESLQLVTRFGNFVVDDLFNNLLGGIIGYGIFMGILTIRTRGIRRSCLYFSPLLLVFILFGSMFTYYHWKEFGNLSIVPSQRANMTQAVTTVDIELNESRTSVPVYKAPTFTKATAEEFVVDFFGKLNVDPTNIEVISYQDVGIYSVSPYNIWFTYLDGSYRFTDFSGHSANMNPKDTDEETLVENLSLFGIKLPQDAMFHHIDTGNYEWTVDKNAIGNQLIDGILKVSYYNDDTVKYIDNELITYDKVRDVQIKSEQEAYEEILDGKFPFYLNNHRVESLHVHQVELSYHLDSKGYYQPVYVFHSTFDEHETTILIPGM